MDKLEKLIEEYIEEMQEKFSEWWNTGVNYSPPSAKELVRKIKKAGWRLDRDDD